MSMRKLKVFLVKLEQFLISEVSEECQVNAYDLWSESSCYQLRAVLSKLSHGFVDFLEIPLGMVMMLADSLAADSSNDPFSKLL